MTNKIFQTSIDCAFLKGGGEMGELTSRYAWHQTTLGAPDQWPSGLKISLSLLLRSEMPMLLFWGPELFCFYNDAFRPALIALDKHPVALGKTAGEIWQGMEALISRLKIKSMPSGSIVPEDEHLGPFGYFINKNRWDLRYSLIQEEVSVQGILVTAINRSQTKETAHPVEDLSGEGITRNFSNAGREQIFRSTIRQAPVGFTIFRGPEFIVEMANETYLQIVDKTEEAFIGKPLFQTLPEVREAVEPLLTDVLTQGRPYHGYEFPVILNRHGQSMLTYFNFVYQPLMEEDGSISGVIVVANEITELVRAKHLLAESEKGFRNMVMQSPIAMTIFRGKEHVVEMANHVMFQKIWRRNEKDVLGKTILEAFPELKDQKYPELLDEVFLHGRVHREYESLAYVRGSDGMKKFYLDYEYSPLREQDGSISGIMVTVNNVTERVEARQKIELAEEKARLAIASAELGTYEIDLNTGEMITSPRFQVIWGLYNTLDRNAFLALLHPDDLPRREQALKEAYITGNLDYESRLLSSNNQKWVKVRGTILFNDRQEPERILGVIQDITEQKVFSEALERMVKERTSELAIANQTLVYKNEELARSNVNLEQFAYAASHDMKEPIRKIHFFSDRLKDTMGKHLSEMELKYFQRMEEATKRMGSLIDDLLSYSQISVKPRQLEPVDLNTVIKQVISDLELQIEEKKALVHYDHLPTVQGHARQIQQAFQNLLGNALKFQTPEIAPVVTISCTRLLGKDTPLFLTPEQREQWYYQVDMKDNGIGFEQQDAEKIFHVFTRLHGNAEYKGTGIGLSIVQKVAENHEGFVCAYSELGKGATFTLYLPVSQDT
ncbi:MAG: PAS domain-containing sensor histidine kinase [Flavisolibacter sp.]